MESQSSCQLISILGNRFKIRSFIHSNLTELKPIDFVYELKHFQSTV